MDTTLWKKRPPHEILRTGIMKLVWPHGQPPLPHRLVPKAFVDAHRATSAYKQDGVQMAWQEWRLALTP